MPAKDAPVVDAMKALSAQYPRYGYRSRTDQEIEMKPFAAAAIALSMLDAAGAAEPELQISRAGSRPVNAVPAQYFSGSVQLEMLFTPVGPDRTSAGSVSFTPGARTNWHTHPLGQTLIVTAGTGRVQRWGGPVQEMRPGDVVRIPPGIKHWHGAAPDSAMIHIAIQEALDGSKANWLERGPDIAAAQQPVAAARASDESA